MTMKIQLLGGVERGCDHATPTVLDLKQNKIAVIGMGEAYATCGEYAGRHICPSCGNSIAHFRHCKRWDCPGCWPYAIEQALRRIRPRLEAVPERMGVFKQWVIYPPRDGALAELMMACETSVSAIYALYMPAMRSFLDVCGVAVLHPYTLTDVGKKTAGAWRESHRYADEVLLEPPSDVEHIIPTYLNAPVSLVPAPEPVRPRGDWAILHEVGIKDAYLKPNLHFHLITRGYVPGRVTDEMVRQGWFISRRRDVGDVDDACALLRYLLSHAAYDAHSKVYRYFLPLGAKFRKMADGWHYESMRCIKCGDEMRYASMDTPDDTRVSDLPLSAVPVSDEIYELRRGVVPPEQLLSELRRLASKKRRR